MNFTSFVSLIMEKVREHLGEEYEITLRKVMKNNGIELTGIVARRNGVNSFPTVYLDDYYDEGVKETEISRMTGQIVERIKAAELAKPIDMSGFEDFSKARERIVFKLIHTERNRELLKNIPNRPFFNLSIVYYYILQDAPFEGTATILIRNLHQQSWRVREEDLYEVAYRNTPCLLPSGLSDMGEVLEGICPKEMLEGMIPMYVLTNAEKLFGAACMIYPDELKHIAQKLNSNLYVLPSSVHEMILIPDLSDFDENRLIDIVTEINHTQLAEEEILADSVFFYNKMEDALYLLDNR